VLSIEKSHEILYIGFVRRSEMTSKKTMTLNLTDLEMDALERLSVQKDLSKTAVLRQALRLYQLVEARLVRGEKLYFENDATKEKAELMLV
jgi:hypothetical protein